MSPFLRRRFGVATGISVCRDGANALARCGAGRPHRREEDSVLLCPCRPPESTLTAPLLRGLLTICAASPVRFMSSIRQQSAVSKQRDKLRDLMEGARFITPYS